MTAVSDAPSPTEIAESLRRNEMMRDGKFDRVFPREQRFRSWLHWTPVKVAARVVALLAPTDKTRILDVGAGVGKLCLIGAAMTRATWVGVERDREMIRSARDAAELMGLTSQLQFVHGDASSVDWSKFDAFYLYNPFAEILVYGTDEHEVKRERYNEAVLHAQQQLAHARPGTRVVTFHGFGGDFPFGFECVHREPQRDDELRLWVRQ